MGQAESVPHFVDLPTHDDAAAEAQHNDDVAGVAAAAAAALYKTPSPTELEAQVDPTKSVLGVCIADYKLEPTVLGEGGFGRSASPPTRLPATRPP